MKKAIDFGHPGDAPHINLLEVYEQLCLLRENLDDFEKAAESLRAAFIAQSHNPDSLQKLQQMTDSVLRQMTNPLGRATVAFTLMTQSFALSVKLLLDQLEIKKALAESADATKH